MKTNSAGLNEELDPTFSSLQVAKLTGVSLRQLQWWDEQCVVKPVHKGHRRLYKMTEVLQVALIIELRCKGLSLQKIRNVLNLLREQYGEELLDSNLKKKDLYLLTNGVDVFLERSQQGIIRIMSESNQPVSSVCVSELLARLQTSCLDLRKPMKSATRSAVQQRIAKVS